MDRHPLSSYFKTDFQQRLALEAVTLDAWLSPSGNLDLYRASHDAFDPAASAEEALRDFKRIYDAVKGRDWQVFRPSSPSKCWPPEQIFETIQHEFQDFSWQSHVNLLNLSQTGLDLRLEQHWHPKIS